MESQLKNLLPTRRFVDTGNSLLLEHFDDLGFLKAALSGSGATDIISVINKSPVIIIAPPWTGKTYVSNRLYEGLLAQKNAHAYGEYVDRRNLETVGAVIPEPIWWSEWLTSTKSALIIIDSVDEGARSDNRSLHSLLDRIESLVSKDRNRLDLVLLCRENERDEDVELRLASIYAPSQSNISNGLNVVKLAPLTRLEALGLAGSDEDFERICTLIRSNNLQQIAGLPKVIQALKSVATGTTIDVPGVWKLVLETSLEERHSTKTSLDERFEATMLIAASLQVSGIQHFTTGHHVSGLITVSDLFPNRRDTHQLRLRDAAYEAMRSMVFVDDGTGYRFAQKHVQEWFAAYALLAVDPARLRGFLIDSNGILYREHKGTIANLLMCAQGDIQNLLRGLYMKLPPRSDTAPWKSSDSMVFIDHILNCAANSPFSLSFGNDLRFNELSAAGLGLLLADRIRDNSLTAVQKNLIVHIASDTNSNDFCVAALDIMRDNGQEDTVRKACAYFLVKHASNNFNSAMEDYAKSFSPINEIQSATKSVIIRHLYEADIWSHLQSCLAVPPKATAIGDATSMLIYYLKKGLSVDNARELLNNIDLIGWADAKSETKSNRHKRFRGTIYEVIGEAVSVLVKDGIADSDIDLLLPLAIRRIWVDPSNISITEKFQRSPKGRRRLFQWRLSHDDETPYPLSAHWMDTSDLPWLEESLDKYGREHKWILELCLRVCSKKEIQLSDKRRIRRNIRQIDCSIVDEYDKAQKRMAAQESRYQKQIQAQKRKQSHYTIAEVVAERLQHKGWSSGDLMRELSSLCFGANGNRYSNVSGEWEDLERELQDKVIQAVLAGLHKGEPCKIPEGAVFYGGSVFDSDAFVYVVNSCPDFIVTPEMVEKWLPSVLRVSSPHDKATIAACIAASEENTVNAIMYEYGRQLRADKNRPYLIENLPDVAWTQSLAVQVRNLIDDDAMSAEVRGSLLRELSRRFTVAAINIANKWIGYAWTDETDKLIVAAYDVLLVHDTCRGITELYQAIRNNSKLDVAALDCLSQSSREGWYINLAICDAQSLAMLYRIVREQYPTSSDPVRKAGVAYSPNKYDDMAQLKGMVLRLLIEQSGSDRQALDALSEDYEEVKNRRDHHVAEVRIVNIARNKPDVPIHEIVRALGNPDYWIVRDGEDLYRLIKSELIEMGKNVGHHLSMLYEPPVLKSKELTNNNSIKTKKRRRLWEDALQAYAKCRLEDRLGHRTSNRSFDVSYERETLESSNQRLDIKCSATTFDNTHVRTIIEVKWSDNKDVSTSLSEQLGNRYLVGENENYGIYLVGITYPEDTKTWIGSCILTDKDNPDSWRSALESQANDYMSMHREVSIAVVIWDLRRSASGYKS